MNTLDLMLLGIGLGGLLYFPILPLIGWVFNLGPKPTKLTYVDWSKKLEQTREWLKELNDD